MFSLRKKKKKTKTWIKPMKPVKQSKKPASPIQNRTPFWKRIAAAAGNRAGKGRKGPGLTGNADDHRFARDVRRDFWKKFCKTGFSRFVVMALQKLLLIALVAGVSSGLFMGCSSTGLFQGGNPAGLGTFGPMVIHAAFLESPGPVAVRAASLESSGPVTVHAASSESTDQVESQEVEDSGQLRVTASIEGLKKPNQAVIYDNADLLTKGQEQALLTHMLPVTRYGDAAFVTRDQVDGSTESYIEKTFRQLYGSSSAVIFLIDMDNRNIWIYSDGRIHDTITNAYSETIADNVYKFAGDGDYYGCGARAFDQMARLLAGESIARPAKYLCNVLLALVLGVLMNYIFVRIAAARSKAGREEILEAIHFSAQVTEPQSKLVKKNKRRIESSSGSRSGGGGVGGGGGGGGHGF